MGTYSPSMIAEIGAQSKAFRFVALLAGEVSKGQIDLPAFPDAVARVKSALSNENVSPAMIAKVVASEAGLAARLMTLANSAIMNPSGSAITELKTAIVRIGYNNVRASSVAYAVAKLRQADELKGIRNELEALWKEAVGTAAMAYALARRIANVNADEAMLTGLVHNIGKVYILSRRQQLTDVQFGLNDTAVIMRDWHGNVGKAIVESWKFAPQIAAAIGDYEEPDRPLRQADLADVLNVATRLWAHVVAMGDVQPGALPDYLVRNESSQRLGMDAGSLQKVLADGAAALKDLKTALGA
ncbi:MAG: HDOD domain-containing protein [Steroidobacteraceae bacterium]